MEQQLLVTLLSHEFFERNKVLVKPEVWPRDLRYIFDALAYAHEHYQRDIELAELGAIIRALNPALTYAQASAVDVLFDQLAKLEPHKGDIGQDILRRWVRSETFRKIAELTALGMVGEEPDPALLRGYFDSLDGKAVGQDTDKAPLYEWEEIMAEYEAVAKWEFNLRTLREVVPGLGPSTLTLIGARPETGKTALWLSLVAGPGGWIDQGARVLCFLNEEKEQRTIARAVMANSGRNKVQLKENPVGAKEAWGKMRGQFMVHGAVGFSTEEVERKTAAEKPDIVIIDNADKVKIRGEFQRDDLRLEGLYIGYRELGKAFNCAVIAASQTDASTEGKTRLDQSNLIGAKTAKAAEADLIMLVGRSSVVGDEWRNINIVKNKLNGAHKEVGCRVQGEISRYVE